MLKRSESEGLEVIRKSTTPWINLGSLLPRFRSYIYKILSAVLLHRQLHSCKSME